MTMALPIELLPDTLPTVIKFDERWQQIPRGWGHTYPTDFSYRLFRFGTPEQGRTCILANFKSDGFLQHSDKSFSIDKVSDRHLLHILFAKLAREYHVPVCDKSLVDFGDDPASYGIATFLDLSHIQLLTDACDAIPLERGVSPSIANKIANFFNVNKDQNLAHDFNRLCLFNLWLGLPLEPRTTILIGEEQTYPSPNGTTHRMLRQRALHRGGLDAILASKKDETVISTDIITPFIPALKYTSTCRDTTVFLDSISLPDKDRISEILTPPALSERQRELMSNRATCLILRRDSLKRAVESLGLV